MDRSDSPAASSGEFRARRRLSPAAVAVLTYAAAALLGATLFSLPALHDGAPLRFVDALFLATSAVCVTGLVPVADVAAQLSPLGEGILLAMMQLGGIGVVLLGALLLRALGRRIGAHHASAIAQSYGDAFARPRELLRDVVLTTLAIEAAGALTLAWCWRDLEGGGWHAVFQAVSAFCNAGFSTFSEGLDPHAPPAGAGAVMLGLVVLGGLGFNVLDELRGQLRRDRKPLSLHARMVLRLSFGLILAGALAIWLTDRREGPWQALFLSVSARTAGFQLDDLSWARAPTLLVLLALMVVGASPASTGGGIKTTNAAIFLRRIVTQVRGGEDVVVAGRALLEPQLRQVVALVSTYVVVLLAVVFALACAVPDAGDPRGFLALLFEATSALGTVGLSTGITPGLPDAGKLVLVFAMIAGRVGPLTLMLFLGGQARATALRYPRERIQLG